MSSSESSDPRSTYRATIASAAVDQQLIILRSELANFAVKQLKDAGRHLHVQGYILGPDRKGGTSPFDNGDDEVAAVSVLLRVAGELSAASSILFVGGQHYAAAALLRQIVEVEYLAWAFEARNGYARRWLRSDWKERQKLFRPAVLRAAAGERFRDKDYRYHCEFGGHPSANSWAVVER